MPLAWALDESAAAAHTLFRFALTGWKVQAELPIPINFEAATGFITEDDMRTVFATGPDRDKHLAVVQQFVDAGPIGSRSSTRAPTSTAPSSSPRASSPSRCRQ